MDKILNLLGIVAGEGYGLDDARLEFRRALEGRTEDQASRAESEERRVPVALPDKPTRVFLGVEALVKPCYHGEFSEGTTLSDVRRIVVDGFRSMSLLSEIDVTCVGIAQIGLSVSPDGTRIGICLADLLAESSTDWDDLRIAKGVCDVPLWLDLPGESDGACVSTASGAVGLLGDSSTAHYTVLFAAGQRSRIASEYGETPVFGVVINNEWQHLLSPTMLRAYSLAVRHGSLVVGKAGDGGLPLTRAAYRGFSRYRLRPPLSVLDGAETIKARRKFYSPRRSGFCYLSLFREEYWSLVGRVLEANPGVVQLAGVCRRAPLGWMVSGDTRLAVVKGIGSRGLHVADCSSSGVTVTDVVGSIKDLAVSQPVMTVGRGGCIALHRDGATEYCEQCRTAGKDAIKLGKMQRTECVGCGFRGDVVKATAADSSATGVSFANKSTVVAVMRLLDAEPAMFVMDKPDTVYRFPFHMCGHEKGRIRLDSPFMLQLVIPCGYTVEVQGLVITAATRALVIVGFSGLDVRWLSPDGPVGGLVVRTRGYASKIRFMHMVLGEDPAATFFRFCWRAGPGPILFTPPDDLMGIGVDAGFSGRHLVNTEGEVVVGFDPGLDGDRPPSEDTVFGADLYSIADDTRLDFADYGTAVKAVGGPIEIGTNMILREGLSCLVSPDVGGIMLHAEEPFRVLKAWDDYALDDGGPSPYGSEGAVDKAMEYGMAGFLDEV